MQESLAGLCASVPQRQKNPITRARIQTGAFIIFEKLILLSAMRHLRFAAILALTFHAAAHLYVGR